MIRMSACNHCNRFIGCKNITLPCWSLWPLLRTVDLHIQVYVSDGANVRAQEVCESRGGRPGLPSLIVLLVSVDVKQH